MVIFISDMVIGYWWLMLGAIIISALYIKQRYATPVGKAWFDRMFLKLPRTVIAKYLAAGASA
jgi:type II secretory pathway component PulF